MTQSDHYPGLPEGRLSGPFDVDRLHESLASAGEIFNSDIVQRADELIKGRDMIVGFRGLSFYRRTRNEQMRLGQDSCYLYVGNRAYNVNLTSPVVWNDLMTAHAARDILVETGVNLDSNRTSPADVILAMDRYAVLESYRKRNGFSDDFTGRNYQKLTSKTGLGPMAIARGVRNTMQALPGEQRVAFAEEVKQAFGRIVDSLEDGSTRAFLAKRSLSNLYVYLTDANSSARIGNLIGLRSIKRDSLQILSDALAEYSFLDYNSEARDRYIPGDDSSLDELDELIGAREVGDHYRPTAKRKHERLLIEVTDMMLKTIGHSGTDYGNKLSKELEKSKTMLSDTSVGSVIPFTAFTNLANQMLQAMVNSPLIADHDLKPLEKGKIDELPEAFRRLMFVASHGSEGEGLSDDLNIERRLEIVDSGVEVLTHTLEQLRSKKVVSSAGAVTARAIRGQLPSAANPWKKWRSGYGQIS